MSKKGIEIFAAVLSHMQEQRGELLRLAWTGKSPCGVAGRLDKQDVRLAQMLEEAKDAVKEEFTKITVQ